MASAMSLEVQVKLNDLMSGGIKKIESEINHLHHAFERVGRTFETLSQKMGGLGIAASFGAGEAIKKYADVQKTLTQIALQHNYHGKKLKDFVENSGKDLANWAKDTNTPMLELIESFDRLHKLGVDLEQIPEYLHNEATAALATGAKPIDLTNLSAIFYHNYHMLGSQMGDVFGKMSAITKLGEMKADGFAHDAQGTFAAAATAGNKDPGVVMALLEIVRRTTANDSMAATDVLRLFTTFNSMHFDHRAMKYAGIDVGKTQREAVLKGQDPLLALIAEIKKYIDKDDILKKTITDHSAEIHKKAVADGISPEEETKRLTQDLAKVIGNARIGKLFANEEDKQAIAAALTHWPDLLKMIDVGNHAGKASLQEDFQEVSDTLANKLKMIGDNFDQALTRAGQSLTPFVDGLKSLSDYINSGIKAWDKVPGSVDHAVQALTVFSTALALYSGAQFLGGLRKGGSAAVAAAEKKAAEQAGKKVLSERELAEQEAKRVFGPKEGSNLPGGKEAAETAAFLGGGVIQKLGIAGFLAYTFEPVLKYFEAFDEKGVAKSDRAKPLFPNIGLDENGHFHWPKLPSARKQNNTLDGFGFNTEDGNQGNTGSGLAPPPPPPQKVDVGGQITIKVDGPGTISGVSSTNPNVPITTDRGTTALRP